MVVSGHLNASSANLPVKNPVTYRTGGLVSPTAVLDVLEKRQISWLCRILHPDRPSPQCGHYNDHTFLAPYMETAELQQENKLGTPDWSGNSVISSVQQI